mgnify:CR=1 FL=1
MKEDRDSLVRDEHPPLRPPARWGRVATVGGAFAAFFLIRAGLPLGTLPGNLDPAAVRTGLAVLSLAAILWLTEALPLALTAILVAIVASLTGCLDVTRSFAGFAHPLIFLFLGGFGMAAALSRQGIDRWIASRILVLGRGRFHPTAIALFLVSALLSMWISNTATVALLLPVALGVLARVSEGTPADTARREGTYLMLGIAYSASIGGIGTLIGTPPNAIAAAALGIGFSEWMGIALPLVAILLPVLFLLLRLVVRPGRIAPFEIQRQDFEFTRPRVATLAVFVGAITCWLAGAPLSRHFGIESGFDTIVAVTALLVLAIARLVDWRDIDRATDWGVLLLFGGGITLSRVLGVTGASAYLADRIRLLAEGWPTLLLVGVLVLFMIFLTELSSNTASTALMVPIFAAVAADLGRSPRALVLPIAMAASCAFMLPIATPPNAIVFASGRVTQGEMMRAGLRLNLLFALILTALAALLL